MATPPEFIALPRRLSVNLKLGVIFLLLALIAAGNLYFTNKVHDSFLSIAGIINQSGRLRYLSQQIALQSAGFVLKAAQIGMALANLRLRDSLREQSIRDVLTGLFNRRYLEESLGRELARAARDGRDGRGLAVFMLDVDHFKKFNDSYGHEAGDAVLRALGQNLRDNGRAGDLPCRFGGEEFTVVLPGATLEAAREWGERLMQRVRRMEVRVGGQVLPGITVSLGLAMFPEHGNDRETLLQAADLALYDAKHSGRDRMAVSGEGA